MISPVNRITSLFSTNNQTRRSESEIINLQTSISNGVEELAMSRSLFQTRDNKTLSDDLGRMLKGNDEVSHQLNEVLGNKKITKDQIHQMLMKLKDDVSRYQTLRFLLESVNLDIEILQYINLELDKIRKKRKKITSLDALSSDTADIQQFESIDGLMLQRLYLGFLEYDGHMVSYFDMLYRSSKKYKEIARFISKMINYEIFGITPNDDIDLYIYMNEKRKLLNIIADVYSFFEEENRKNSHSKEKHEEDDLSFINSILLNFEVDSLCDKMLSSKVSFLITLFSKLPMEVFYSLEDKENVISTMRNNVTNRFVNNGLR